MLRPFVKLGDSPLETEAETNFGSEIGYFDSSNCTFNFKSGDYNLNQKFGGFRFLITAIGGSQCGTIPRCSPTKEDKTIDFDCDQVASDDGLIFEGF